MAKTLEDAIGCWTVDPASFKSRFEQIRFSIRTCKTFTQQNQPPERLLEELRLLKRRLDSLNEVVTSAVTRCEQIITTKELV
jgi:hypothetical protein